LSSGVAAFFDVDGTLTRTTILDPLIWYQRAHLPRWRFRLWLTGLLLHGPYYLWVDRRSRSRVNVLIYRRYAGVPLEQLRRWHREHFAATLQRRLFPGALECIRDHHRQGHRVVLVTGGLDLVLQPLAELVGAEHLIAMQLCEKDGLCTGELGRPPIADRQKAVLVREYAKTHDMTWRARLPMAIVMATCRCWSAWVSRSRFGRTGGCGHWPRRGGGASLCGGGNDPTVTGQPVAR
jgi:HAD superfamily hydrolase (TIGR01490 family)